MIGSKIVNRSRSRVKGRAGRNRARRGRTAAIISSAMPRSAIASIMRTTCSTRSSAASIRVREIARIAGSDERVG